MKNDKTYLKRIRGRDIWITVMRPLIVDEKNSHDLQESEKFCCAFRIDGAPLVIDGEFLRDSSGNLRWFDEADEAVDAAVVAAGPIVSV
jgi:hypothetical protein